MNRFSIGAGIALLVFALPATAADQYRFQKETAYVYFEKYDECGYTIVSVEGYMSIVRDEPGSPNPQPSASVYYEEHNFCKQVSQYGSGYSSDVKFRILPSLQSASLTGMIPLYDESTNSNRTVEVDLQWESSSPLYPSTSRYSYSFDFYRITSRSRGASRDADISGNVRLDGNSLLEDNGLIEGSLYAYATLSSVKNGTLEIWKW